MKPSQLVTRDHILISLIPQHASNIYAGIKSVEFRRRRLNISVGTLIWIYEKVPTGAITGCATVKSVITNSPEDIWNLYSSISGLAKSDFFEYFKNSRYACAIELTEVAQLETPLTLVQLRHLKSSFQPPQFFTRLSEKNTVLIELSSRTKNTIPCSHNSADSESIFLVA